MTGESVTTMLPEESLQRRGRLWPFALLLIPFLTAVCPALYNQVEPTLFGVPFFYWFQMLWIVVTAVVVGLVALLTE
ncbi:DUF3311 domain-containing protein [Thermogemmatispora onikobensis]|uniref:DUF3311 domain-containing protein n=1 Tax=Thermogemmatispora onikobensis TaxID=732234 RepID=UPI001C4077A6|nr:DUF3311 domain-containing protein [Thermogemmatispora onikobensis]